MIRGGNALLACALALLLTLATPGCVSFDTRADVVLVEESFVFEGSTTGVLADFGLACPMVRYERDPLSVELLTAPPDFEANAVVITDRGDAWREAFPEDADQSGLTVVATSGGQGGALAPIFAPFSRGTATGSFGLAGPLRMATVDFPTLRWSASHGGEAWLDDEPLPAGETLVKRFEYDVPADDGALHVIHWMNVTYLGRTHVTVEPPTPDDGC